MKNIYFLLLFLLLCGCSVNKPLNWAIGMSEQEFLSTNNKISTVEANNFRTVYARCNDYGWNCWYFYFYKGYMYQMDDGVQQPDILIETHEK